MIEVGWRALVNWKCLVFGRAFVYKNRVGDISTAEPIHVRRPRSKLSPVCSGTPDDGSSVLKLRGQPHEDRPGD